jgi:UrcA family protein
MDIAALVLTGALALAPAPDLSVSTHGLDPARASDAARLAERFRDASRAWCGQHHRSVTPHARAACEPEMRRRLAAALPPDDRRGFVRAGGMRVLNRR